MADFRTDPNLTEEQRLEIVGDFWVETDYNIRKKKKKIGNTRNKLKKTKKLQKRKRLK